MKALLFIISLFFIVACTEEARVINHDQLQIRNDVAYAVNETEPFTGKVIGTYPSGQKSKEETYVNGIKDGLERLWLENGHLLYEVDNVNGEWEGKYISRHENGQLAAEIEYVNSKENGSYRVWSPDGQLKVDDVYENGIKVH